MSFVELSEKQLTERMEYLVGEMDKIWENVEPQIKEFNAKRAEVDSILEELHRRQEGEKPQTTTDG